MIKYTWICISFGVFLDQLTKFFARNILTQGSVDLGLFRLDLVFNTGAAYGLFSNYTHFLLVAGVIVIGYLGWSLRSFVNDLWTMFMYAFLMSGAIGNTLDRLIFGAVTDFINIKIIPVFNFADVFINIGLLLLILHYFIYDRKKSTHST